MNTLAQFYERLPSVDRQTNDLAFPHSGRWSHLAINIGEDSSWTVHWIKLRRANYSSCLYAFHTSNSDQSQATPRWSNRCSTLPQCYMDNQQQQIYSGLESRIIEYFSAGTGEYKLDYFFVHHLLRYKHHLVAISPVQYLSCSNRRTKWSFQILNQLWKISNSNSPDHRC